MANSLEPALFGNQKKEKFYMTKLNTVACVYVVVLLAGCGSMPSTPDLLVQNVKDNKMFAEKDIFEVKRPIEEIAEVFKKKANECLKQTVTSTSRDSTAGVTTTRREVRSYKPMVVVSKQRTRLTLQSKTIEGATELGDIPPDGWYMMVADAYPVSKNVTRIESYMQWPGTRAPFMAVKHWASGTNMGCPDLTK